MVKIINCRYFCTISQVMGRVHDVLMRWNVKLQSYFILFTSLLFSALFLLFFFVSFITFLISLYLLPNCNSLRFATLQLCIKDVFRFSNKTFIKCIALNPLSCVTICLCNLLWLSFRSSKQELRWWIVSEDSDSI